MNFQKCYQRLVAAAGPYEDVLGEIAKRSAVINFEHRITGNAIIQIVQQIIEMKDELSPADLQSAMDCFIESQVLIPGEWKPISADLLKGTSPRARLLRSIQHELEDCKETV
jgi:hypothetical protein